MTPAVKLALVYMHITGKTPSHIRVETAVALYDHLTSVSSNKLTAEAIKAIHNHPMMRAHRFMTARDFTRVPKTGRDISSYISYDKYVDEKRVEGGISRNGSAWIFRVGTKQGCDTFTAAVVKGDEANA